MPDSIKGKREDDLLDDHLQWMNYHIWAEDISDSQNRIIKARYYADITYIDFCIGRLMANLEASGALANTAIIFASDHGDHLGDHHAWQKESFYESSARIPLVVSAPSLLASGVTDNTPSSLLDLFAICSALAGGNQEKDGKNVLSAHGVGSTNKTRNFIFSTLGIPGTIRFKLMIKTPQWKYIYIANGNKEQLFSAEDQEELSNQVFHEHDLAMQFRQSSVNLCRENGYDAALDSNGFLLFVFQQRERTRCRQFPLHLGITDFSYPQIPSLPAWSMGEH